MTCKYNSPSVFDVGQKKVYEEVRALREKLAGMTRKKTVHPYDFAVDQQRLRDKIRCALAQIHPRVVET